jgi:signal transduction histidine kinase/streptogramin lyase
VAAHPDGSVWLGSGGMGVHRIQEGNWQSWQVPDGLAGNWVRSLLVARDGKVWIASEFPRRLQSFHEGKFHLIQLPPELTDMRAMRAITEATDGTVWVGTARGDLMRVEGDHLVRVTADGETPGPSIRTLHANPDGSLWIGYAGAGLGRWKNGEFARVTREQGLRENHVSQILPDGMGSVWMAGNLGLSLVGEAELENVFAGRADRARARAFGRAEGLPGLQANFDFSPASCVGRDGRLWFAMRNGLLLARSDRIRKNFPPPPVVLEGVNVDDQTAAAYHSGTPVSGLRLPPGHNKLEFEFAALSFTSPENVHFRYQLRGFDQKWVEAGTDNRAIYPRLPGGEYEFRVIACNHAGVWNETGASLRFTVAPFYWQTWWFRLLALAFFTGVVIAIVRYVSFRRLRENMRELEQQAALHQERARIARDMHDEVGAKLTRLSLLSDMAAASSELPTSTGADVREISDTARETILAFDEIVWAVNPRNDTLADLVGYLCRHAEDFFDGSRTDCIFDLPVTIPSINLATETRHEVFLAAKEALTNVAKYAAAPRVCLRLLLHPDAFDLIIEDDGCGFEPAAVTARPGGGNGLPNMRERMRRIGGRFECLSHPGGGTLIKFHVPFEK